MTDKQAIAILIDAVFPAAEQGSVEDPRRQAALDALGVKADDDDDAKATKAVK